MLKRECGAPILKFVDPRLEGFTFRSAVNCRNIAFVSQIIQQQPWLIACKFENGNTLAHYSALVKWSALLELLAASGGDIASLNAFGEGPIHICAQNLDLSGVQVLTEGGVAVSARSSDGAGILHIAVFASGHYGDYVEQQQCLEESQCLFIEEIIARDGDLLESVDRNCQTPLFYALRAACSYKEATTVLRRLLTLGARVNAQDEQGNTPLHQWAESPNRVGIAELLLEFGADVRIKNHENRSALEVLTAYYTHRKPPRELLRLLGG